MTTVRDYSSIYSIKDLAINQIAPKYFDLSSVNQLNIGLIGYMTEIAAVTTEDTFNAVSTFIQEMFPNRAVIPETIYSNASLFQEDKLFASPAELNMMIFLNESDIYKLGQSMNGYIEFVLDSNLIINIEDIQFMLDYDIKISAKPFKNDYIFTAYYDMNFTNTISDITNPYIKIKRIKYANTNYLGLFVKVRQVEKLSKTEFIINNDKINLPTINFEFTDELANFEVFYKAPDSSQFIQLTKRMTNTTPLKNPFCFYRFKNDKTVELSFTSRDNYFQPKFNSELNIVTYTTKGKGGNFPFYKGNEIRILPKSDDYPYNNNIVIFGSVQSESVNGTNRLSLDELKNIVVENFSTVKSFTTENDLQSYFTNFKYRYGQDVLFVKKRDDIFERLFSAFSLLKDETDEIYPTNTLSLELEPADFDMEYEQSNTLILKAGHLIRYKDNSLDTAENIDGLKINNDFSNLTDEFIYTNPYLMTVTKNTGIVGFYMNSFDKRYPLDYTYVNSDSTVQFICNNLFVKRNAIMGEDTYTLSLLLMPATELETPLVDENGVDLGLLKVKAMFQDENGTDFCYINFNIASYDVGSNIYTLEALLQTDDYMTINQKIRMLTTKNLETSVTEIKLIDMVDCTIDIFTFYKYTNFNLPHKFNYLENLSEYVMTNQYSTRDEKVEFLKPLNILRSTMKYIQIDATNYSVNLSAVPLVKATTMLDNTLYSYFMSILSTQYIYMNDILGKITNNYAVDMKFYNTYGKSRNFIVGESGVLLDKVNCGINFKIKPNVMTNAELLVRDVKLYIKEYIEKINSSKGANAIYVSNLIKLLETKFTEMRYLRFVKINNYDSSIQIIENKTTNLNTLTKEERRGYVPEYLTIDINDIDIQVIPD